MAGSGNASAELDGDFGQEQEATAAPAGEPGDQLFGDAVGVKGKRPAATRAAPATEDDVQLRDSVASLYQMVKDLEVQLNHMISINEAAERDLESSRKARRGLEKERSELKRKIEQMELDAQSASDLREELRHMTRENERVIEQLQAEQDKIGRTKELHREADLRLAQLQEERDLLREEIDCLEAQLEAGVPIRGEPPCRRHQAQRGPGSAGEGRGARRASPACRDRGA